MPVKSKTYATSPCSRVTQRGRSRCQGLQSLLNNQTLAGACLSVSHSERSPQTATLERSDG